MDSAAFPVDVGPTQGKVLRLDLAMANILETTVDTAESPFEGAT